jgi:WD40 repeat protein
VREIRVHTPRRGERLAENAVRKLQFTADAARLLAWVGWEWRSETQRQGYVSDIYTHDPATGETRVLGLEWAMNFTGFQGEPVVSRDARFVAFEYDDLGHEEGGAADVVDLTKPEEPGGSLVMGKGRTGGFAFAADGSALFAARNTRNRNDHTAEVVRQTMDAVIRNPTRFRDEVNPFTGGLMRVPIRNLRWQVVATLPRGEAATAFALSADARLAAVGTHGGSLHVVDVKKKRAVFSNQWSGRHIRDRVAMRVGFHPNDEWVGMLANGRLFVFPLKAGIDKAWQTKSTLGYLHDFAYHPAGHTLAVVDAQGRARYLDPLTGRAKEEFRWKRGPLYSVAFSPDGLLCAAGAGGGRVVLWDVDE